MKTNLKSFIALCSALLMMASATACGSSEEKALLEDPVVSEQTEQSEQSEQSDLSLPATSGENTSPDASEPPAEEEKKDTYESDVLALYHEQYLLKDVFDRTVSRTDPSVFLTADNGIYSVKNLSENLLEEIENVKNVFTIGGKFACEDENGRLFVQAQLRIIRGYSDVIGRPVYAHANNWDDEMQMVSIDDEGRLYANSFDYQDAKRRYDNQPLVIYDFENQIAYDKVDSFETVDIPGRYSVGYAVIGDTLLYGPFAGISQLNGQAQIWLLPVDERVDKVFDWGYMHTWTSPLFSMKDDEDNLYYVNENKLFTVELPDGHKVSELTRVLFTRKVLMVFEDNTVYAGDLTDSTMVNVQLTELTELSAYAAEGKIRDYYVTSYKTNVTPSIVVLMDDNVMYEYVGE